MRTEVSTRYLLVAAGRSLRLRLAIVRLLRSSAVPGVLVLVRSDGRTLHLRAGVADREDRRRIDPADRFRIGSVTKLFVATLVLQLVGDQRLLLSDTISSCLPSLVPELPGEVAQDITVEHLLGHTSGLPDYVCDPALRLRSLAAPPRDWAPLELVEIALRHELLSSPGQRFGYSNTNYVILGLIVEAITGVALAQELRRRLLDPLHLVRTDLPSAPGIGGRHARGYVADPDGRLGDATVLSPSAAWAAGGMVSTTSDLADFLAALLGGRVLSPRLLGAMKHTHATGPRTSYGLGLARLVSAPKDSMAPAWGHSGGMLGYLTFAYGSEDGARQLVVAVNASRLPPRAQRDLSGVMRSAGRLAGLAA